MSTTPARRPVIGLAVAGILILDSSGFCPFLGTSKNKNPEGRGINLKQVSFFKILNSFPFRPFHTFAPFLTQTFLQTIVETHGNASIC
jgi:hypothetical protein